MPIRDSLPAVLRGEEASDLSAERRALLAGLLPRFAAESRHAGLEEAALEFVEHEDAEGLVHLVGTLPVVAAGGGQREVLQLLDIAFPVIERAGRAGEVAGPLR